MRTKLSTFIFYLFAGSSASASIFIFLMQALMQPLFAAGTHQYGTADVAALKSDLAAGTYDVYELTESGGTYAINVTSAYAITLISSVTIKASEGLAAKPILTYSSITTTNTPSIFHTITPNVTITLKGLQINGSNALGTQPLLLNAGTSAATNCLLVADNCYIYNFTNANGCMRVDGTGSSINVQGSVFDNCSTRLFFFTNSQPTPTTTANCGSIYLKNNVFSNYNSSYGVIFYYSAGSDIAVGTTATVDHCTFYNCTTSVSNFSWLLRFQQMTGAINITNCIFDQISRSLSFSSPTPTKDYCYLAGFATVPTGTNTFATVPSYTNSGSLDFSLTNKSSFLCADGSICGVNKYTNAVTAITNTTATSGGSVSAYGAEAITAQGVCWSVVTNPTTADSKTTDAGSSGVFTSSITGLIAGTTYYVRAYVTCASGTYYGSQVSFTTTGQGVPTLGVTTASASAAPTTTSGGIIYSDGSSAITARGVCWNTSPAPTITDSKTTDGTAIGSFSSSITGLSTNTTYYVRSYATNGIGTAYGTEQSFTTGKIEPTNQATSFAKGAVTSTEIPLSFTAAAAGSQLPDGYLLKMSTSSITDPVDGVDPADVTTLSNGVANVKVTTSPITSFNGLSKGTMYNYKIYSYTGSDATINYNVTSVPAINIATLPDCITSLTLTPSSATTANISWNAPSEYNSGTESTIVFVKVGGAITLGTPSIAPSNYIPNSVFNSGTSYEGDAGARCVYNGDGTNVTITGLTAGLRYYVLVYTVMDASNSDNTNSYSIINTDNALITALPEPTNQVTNFAKGTISTTSIPLTWTAAATGSQAPDGYLIKLNSGTIVDPVDLTDPADVTTVSGNAANMKIVDGTSTSASSFAGLSPGTMYNYNIYSYSNTGNFINFKLTSVPTISAATLPNAVSSSTFMATGTTTADITWVAASGYNSTNNSTLVFVKASSAVTLGTPSNAPGYYTANTLFGTGTAYQGDPAAYCVYNGDGTNVSITGLNANTTYTVLIYTLVDAANSDLTRSYSAGVSGTLLPSPPISPLVVGADGQATVSFTAPSNNAGSAITSYSVTSSPGNYIQTGSASPIVLVGLNNGTAYTFTVIATNANGNSAASSATASVIPTQNVSVTTSVASSTLGLTAGNDVTIASGGILTVDGITTVQNLEVGAGGKIILSAALTVLGNVVFKGTDAASFSANLGSSGMAVTGTVSYQKTMDDTKWYFISFPCNVTIDDISKYSGTGTFQRNVDWFLKYYDGDSRTTNLGTSSNWKTVTDATLTAYKGYIFGLKTGNTPYVVSFPLTNAIVASEGARSIPVVAHGSALSIAESHKGWNLVGQPYLSKYNGTGSNLNYMVLFEGGSYYSTYANTDVTSLDPFTAYFVQAGTSLAGTGVTFALDNGAGTNYRLLAPSSVGMNASNRVKINFTTPTGTDNANLILADSQNAVYQIGEDMEKWVTTGTDKPQIYTLLDGIKYAYNALPVADVQNLPLAIYTNTTGNSTISADGSMASGLSQLLLSDNFTGTTTDLLTSDYNFTASAGSNTTRFSISARGVATNSAISKPCADDPILSIVDGKLKLTNFKAETVVRVYDAMGHLVAQRLCNSITEIALPKAGVYAVQLNCGTQNWIRKVVAN